MATTEWGRGSVPGSALRMALAVALVAGLAACGGKEQAPVPASTPAAGAPPQAAAPSAPAEPVADESAMEVPMDVNQLLDAARTAMREQRLAHPPGDNAIAYYLRVLDADPSNRHAQLAILELMPLAQGATERMIESDRLDEAQAAVALLRRAQPTSVVVTTLEQRIGVQRRAAEQRRLAEEQAQRLAERQAQQAAQQAAAQPAPATETRPATTAAAPPPRPAAEPASQPTTPPVQPPAAQVAAATPTPSVAADSAPQNRDFQVTRRVNPTYPQQALRARQSGWVELSFTVTANGDVEDVEVVNANPRRVFDREAVRAMGQWKFTPRVENGRPVAAKARQRLEFSLD